MSISVYILWTCACVSRHQGIPLDTFLELSLAVFFAGHALDSVTQPLPCANMMSCTAESHVGMIITIIVILISFISIITTIIIIIIMMIIIVVIIITGLPVYGISYHAHRPIILSSWQRKASDIFLPRLEAQVTQTDKTAVILNNNNK